MRGDRDSVGEYGYLYSIDTESATLITNRACIKYSDKSPYVYSGHSFGVRGVCVVGNELFVADSSNVFYVFDPISLSVIDRFVIPDLKDVHQIVERNGLIYAVSCGNDRLVILDRNKVVSVVDLSSYSNIIDNYGVNFNLDWGSGRLHFNSLTFDNNCEINLYCSVGMVFNRTIGSVLFCGLPLDSPHNLLPFNGGLIINNSNVCETVFLAGEKISTIFKTKTVEHYTGYNKPGYTRGLCKIGDSLYIGSSPVIISEIDIHTYAHKNSFLISDNPNEVIYGICSFS